MSQFRATKDRLLGLRLRPDLVASPVEMAGVATWVVKDPVSLEHFHFSAEEFALMELLRDRVSLADLEREFARMFPPRTITDQEAWAFLSRLHEAGLVMSDAEGQGRELLTRMREERTRRWLQSAAQLTSMQFRGINPDAFLTAVHDRCRWLFSRFALVAAVAIVLFAASLIVGHVHEFRERLPELEALADWRNLIWLLLAIGAVKVCHELGHALTCKHFGGEVHELGLMLLVFAPCLYCDVTDSWRLASKWQRILVSAAGMLVELVIASLATIVWWYAQPGLLQLVALDVMIVATVSTLVVNGNPLLRYDGYYILSDLVESPNLWQRSRDVWRDMFHRGVLGLAVDDDPLVPARQRWWLAAYAIASKVYVSMVLVLVVWGLVRVLTPWHLETLAYVVGLTAIGGALFAPVRGAWQLAHNPVRWREIRRGRLATVASLALVGVVMILAWPVNYYVRAPLVLLPADAARVYATVDGVLTDALPAGTEVKPGETIARLDNSEMRLDLAQLTGEHELARLQLANLDLLRRDDPEANAKLPGAQATLEDFTHRLDDRQRDTERLKLTAPVAGTVISAPRVDQPEPANGRLRTWSGVLLDKSNRGASLEAGTLVCLVGDPARLSAVLLVNDNDISRVRPGQTVRLRLDQLPGQVLAGEVVDVAHRDAQAANSNTAARADLEPLFAGLVPPGRADVEYQVRVQIALPESPLAIGGRGQAKIAAERITLARWILRYFAQTFRLPG